MSTTISGSNGIVFPDATSMQTGQQAVKAWVNFNGTGVVAIRAGYNVASITDNGTGDYTVNFATAMVDDNYAWSAGANRDATPYIMVVNSHQTVTPSAAALRLVFYATAGGLLNQPNCVVAVFR